ncbi:MAG TPA: DUF1326 domain-containing protein [Methyloceanibacter sp.]|nr:DUF1326 domain-containing protein [Methyloceanibacter sp.]
MAFSPSPPSHGDCSVLYAWHIEAGRYDKLNLDHINVVLAAYAAGHMVGFFERFLGVKSAPITYEASGSKRALRIPGLVTADIEAISGQEGRDTTVTGNPLCLAPGEPFVVAKSKSVELTDYDWHWRFGESAGGYSAFTYHS